METLIKYLQTAKIYAIPYLKKEQITSGTLSYALGVGLPIVSTPFWHAEELLADGRGKLVPFNNPSEMAKQINHLLSNDTEREMMRLKGFQYSRTMTWKEVARKHFKAFSGIKEKKPIQNLKKIEKLSVKNKDLFNYLPEINLTHLKTMTDSTGLFQHAKYMTPDFHHGYCVDDNARGLIALTKYYTLKQDKEILPLIQKYLAFLHYAFNHENGRFRNFMSYDRRWMELAGSEDSHARALWGLGAAIKEAPNSCVRSMSMQLFLEALPAVEHFTSPRAWCFATIGIQSYLTIYSGDLHVRKIRDYLANKIHELFKNNASEDWPWCENTATYANAILPHALITAGSSIPNKEMFDYGIKALKWLLKIQTAPEGHISVIGNNGWLKKNGNRAMFDQQPIEVKNLVEACLDAFTVTGDKLWLEESKRCLSWFLGNNDLQHPVCDCRTGGCCDGLERQGVNRNQGAESTLAWLISLISMHYSKITNNCANEQV